MPGRIRNLLTVCKGLFVADSEATVRKKVRQLALRFTWELPNTLSGFIVSAAAALLFKTEVRFFHGSTFIKVLGKNDRQGYHAATIGPYIIGSRYSDPLLAHEYGHCLQSRIYGPGYLPLIALPSFMSAIFTNGKHDTRWYEKDADTRGKRFVNGHIA
jgi:hypothetical protein